MEIKQPNLAFCKSFLDELSYYRNAPIRHYTENFNEIESRILPLVETFDTEMTTPIYSCAGHWHRKKEPYVTFVVLPAQENSFQNFLKNLLYNTPEDLVFFRIYHRHRPKRYENGPGPFIDWSLILDVPFHSFENEKKCNEFLSQKINKYNSFFSQQFNGKSSDN